MSATSSTPEELSPADLGYILAIRLMGIGELRAVSLWQPEAFNRFREAVVDGKASQIWLAQFNDYLLRKSTGDCTYAKFISEAHVSYPSARDLPTSGPFVVLCVERLKRSEQIVIIQPEADQALIPHRGDRWMA